MFLIAGIGTSQGQQKHQQQQYASSSSSISNSGEEEDSLDPSTMPYFDYNVPRNISNIVGQHAFLLCRVYRMKDKSVSGNILHFHVSPNCPLRKWDLYVFLHVRFFSLSLSSFSLIFSAAPSSLSYLSSLLSLLILVLLRLQFLRQFLFPAFFHTHFTHLEK